MISLYSSNSVVVATRQRQLYLLLSIASFFVILLASTTAEAKLHPHFATAIDMSESKEALDLPGSIDHISNVPNADQSKSSATPLQAEKESDTFNKGKNKERHK